MSERTNEDTLKEMLKNTAPWEALLLLPSQEEPFMIEVYRYPNSLSEEFYCLSEEEKQKYWIGSLMAIELRKVKLIKE